MFSVGTLLKAEAVTAHVPRSSTYVTIGPVVLISDPKSVMAVKRAQMLRVSYLGEVTDVILDMCLRMAAFNRSCAI